MNARTVRRAIERKEARKAQKQARKEAAKSLAAAAPGSFPAEEDYFTSERESLTAELEAQKATLAQLQANRRNAMLSTGPKTPEGKAISSRNALKTGLTGKTVLLADEDAALYQRHVESYFAELKPVGDRETELAQSIADSKWRLGRIPTLEFGYYALGRIEFADQFQSLPKAEAAVLIEVKTHQHFQKQLNNLSIQESRLRRQCEKDTAELRRLQELRAQTERAKAKRAATAPKPQPNPEAIGFEFSTLTLDALETDPGVDADLATGLLTRPQAA